MAASTPSQRRRTWAASSPEWFEEKIRPLLAARCYECHTDEKSGGLLRLLQFTSTHRAAAIEDNGEVQRGALRLRHRIALDFDLDDDFSLTVALIKERAVNRGMG